MDFSKIAPTTDDFLEQVDAINFDQEEIDFQKKIIKKHTKFKSFDQYIENCHFVLANIIDLNKVLNGFSNEAIGASKGILYEFTLSASGQTKVKIPAPSGQ